MQTHRDTRALGLNLPKSFINRQFAMSCVPRNVSLPLRTIAVTDCTVHGLEDIEREVREATGAKEVRLWTPGMSGSIAYNPDRFNLCLDATGRCTAEYIG